MKIAAWDQVGAAQVMAPEGLIARANMVAITYGAYLGHALWPANLHLAYDALSDGMKDMLEGLTAIFSNERTYGPDAQRFKDKVKAMSVAPRA